MTKGAFRPRLPGIERFSALYLWAVFIIIFGLWEPSLFLSNATFQSIATGQAVSGMVAIAVLIPLVCGEFDLSVGANANFVGLVAILLQVNDHWPVLPAVLLSVALGFVIGAANALIAVRFRVSSFIATLGMGSVLSAFEVIVTGGFQPAPATSSTWNNLTQDSLGGVQLVVYYFIALCIVVWWFLGYTAAGRYLYAIGGNPVAARLSGVRVDRWRSLVLILAGGIAGLSGVLFTSLSGPSLTFGPTLLLPAFAAAFLGVTQIKPGRFNVWGTFVAIYVLATGVQGLQLASGVQWLSDMFDGVALIVAVGLSVAAQGRDGRTRSGRARGQREQASEASPGAHDDPSAGGGERSLLRLDQTLAAESRPAASAEE
jgi:ribose transport system permease protein